MKSSKITLKIIWNYLKIIVLLGIPVTLWILPADYFDHGKSISLFALFNVEDYIYSTGMTRGIMHLIHLQFEQAWVYNKLTFIVLPLLFLIWLKWLLDTLGIKVPKLLKWI